MSWSDYLINQRRSKLQQIEMLISGQMRVHTNNIDTSQAVIEREQRQVQEIEAILTEAGVSF